MKGFLIVLCLSSISWCKINAFHLGIVNGKEVEPHSKPYQVFLKVDYVYFEQICSGVIVSSRDILTTGRCIAGSDNVTVYAGAHDVTTHESTQVRVVASDYHICDKFDWDYGYNVAIVKLKEPLQFNDYISPIQINMNPGNLLGKYADFSGWGGRRIEETSSPVLTEASGRFVNPTVCEAHYFFMTETDVCLSGINGATTCFDDAGGPVIMEDKLVALLSPKELECGQWRSFAAVELSRFPDWLRENLEPDVQMVF